MTSKNNQYPVALILIGITCCLSGCLSHYEYNSVSNDDPTIFFGDPAGAIGNIQRIIEVNVDHASNNRCEDFRTIGSIGNTLGTKRNHHTFSVPANNQIAIRGYATNVMGTLTLACVAQPILFTPEIHSTYYVDVNWHLKGLTSSCETVIKNMTKDGIQVGLYKDLMSNSSSVENRINSFNFLPQCVK
jgi:hypothetical protein